MRTPAERAALKSARMNKKLEKRKKREEEDRFNELISCVNDQIEESISRGRFYAYYNIGIWSDFSKEESKRIYNYFVERGFSCDVGYCAGGYVKVAWGEETIEKDKIRSHVLDL